mmetsp:Transcript_14793/g.34375  ORF Transcript_14793/g.34375 Transcript_14793/m.34375 type:complete len:681 (-) Transcript_14793:135-2177(-)|eukprot:CAMPEP_0197195992 /NCGR_PEP_ID=MMETSP1423-20130617/32114_1 /TAXON_ID=476441 /ORGANISM="Pseudo-nitzschia heimii, Strain UNC1101" /LENGTH=680 /DNA_ID=CAMNT_0042649755 /DNA_START=154 /DNA_END=2196 /DNA_ORIENTATION=-
MAFSRLMLSVSSQQIAVAAFGLFLVTAVDSLLPPFSSRQLPSSLTIESSTSSGTLIDSVSIPVSSHRRITTKSKTHSATSLFATSLDNTKLDEDDTKEIDVDDSQSSHLPSVSKFRQLKDVMWIRETLEDLTAAEFALSVEQQSDGAALVNGNGAASANSEKKKKRAVDYENLLSRLTKRTEEVACQSFGDYKPLLDDDGALRLDDNLGMGRYACSNEERTILMKRILKTRLNLSWVIDRNDPENTGENGDLSTPPSFLEDGEMLELPDSSNDLVGGEGNSTAAGSDPKLYVRDDGTVDWEGALQDRAALRKFGGAVWARINGQTPDDLGEEDEDESARGSVHETKPAVTARIEDTPAIQEARKDLESLKKKLKEEEKAHTALVESGISAGQAVANVKLASVDPVLRNDIRRSEEGLRVLQQKISYQNLVYELERIYTYLSTELQNPTTKGYIPLQDRLNVAEYGLLESQVESCSRDLNTKGVLDADIVAVIAEQMIDFKRRLGIDYYVAGLTYDREAISRWLNDLYQTAKVGLRFYVKGTRLFWNDLVYCFSLIGRAAQGVTLKPREVRTIRRTFKDVITFIPVVIILIIPLSPVGHVLVFGAIQRVFPNFFPSCFTEQRQNLLQLYETTEFSEVTIKENLSERLTRFIEALAFFIVNKTRNAYRRLTNTDPEESDENK